MTFLWPHMLSLLLLIPLLIGAYVWLLKRKRSAMAVSDLGLIKQALGQSKNWKRHVPPALLLLAIGVMLVAAARPVAQIKLPSQQETIMLAMDVSGSMRATDVKPTRIVAAQDAAKAFLTELPRHVRVGIVAFAGSAQLAQLPTLSREDLITAIDRFQLQRGTATGNGIMLSLATLFPDDGIDIGELTYGRPSNRGWSLDQNPKEEKPKREPVPAGSYNSAAIIMLTDGQRTTGVDPMEAAKMAADRGVRVYTVGIGTIEGETIGAEGWSMRVRLDEATLKAIATRTDAEYYYAGSAADLKKVYEKLSSRITLETRETEISSIFAAVAAALAVLAAALSLWWFNRIM
jgi:Ca-activated chloride channel homolog